MDIGKFLRDLKRKDLRLFNLFELHEGQWRCTIINRKGDCYDSAHRDTPEGALKAALSNYRKTEKEKNEKNKIRKRVRLR